MRRLETLIASYKQSNDMLLNTLRKRGEMVSYEGLEAQLARIQETLDAEHPPRMPKWKRFVYGAGLAFLIASSVKYWIGRVNPPPQYVVVPYIQRTAGGSYGR